MPELRIDPIVGRRVYVAEDRAARPHDFLDAGAPLEPPAQRRAHCPFCAGHEADTPAAVAETLDENGQWQVRVVPNKYPAVGSGGAAAGIHEVIVESPRHVATLLELDEHQLALVLAMYRDRLRQCASRPELAAGIVFKNSGAAAGASLEHIHSQLIALPYAPPGLVEEVDAAAERFAAAGRCPYCELIAQERAAGERLILQSEGFVALAAYAGRQPYETWILPAAHSADYLAIDQVGCAALARLLKHLATALDRVAPGAAYNLMLHTVPFSQRGAEHYHWHWELVPRLSQLAGLELGAGVYINPLAPEHAAERLRAALA